MSSAPAIEVRGLTKEFKRSRKGREWLTPWRRLDPVRALRGVDLQVWPGELVTLLGPNGAGKTTLLKVLATLVMPTTGSAHVFGEPLGRNRRSAPRQIGYVLAEERSFYWRLSCLDNLRFFGILQGLSAARAVRRAEETASMLGLTEQLTRDFADLSTGQRQRMAIARGLLADPPVLLFDEATRSLDPGRSERLRGIIRSVLVEQNEKAVLFATHDLHEAEALADRVVLMKDGVVAAAGAYAEVESKIHATFSEEADEEDAEFRRLFPELAGEG